MVDAARVAGRRRVSTRAGSIVAASSTRSTRASAPTRSSRAGAPTPRSSPSRPICRSPSRTRDSPGSRSTTRGRAAHGSRPAEGRDAILYDGPRAAASRSARIARSQARAAAPLLGTCLAARVDGGRRTRVSSYPDRCTLRIERRTLPGERDEGVLDRDCRRDRGCSAARIRSSKPARASCSRGLRTSCRRRTRWRRRCAAAAGEDARVRG